jgi:hypothetical protein
MRRPPALRAKGLGRPTKKDRRALERWEEPGGADDVGGEGGADGGNFRSGAHELADRGERLDVLAEDLEHDHDRHRENGADDAPQPTPEGEGEE